MSRNVLRVYVDGCKPSDPRLWDAFTRVIADNVPPNIAAVDKATQRCLDRILERLVPVSAAEEERRRRCLQKKKKAPLRRKRYGIMGLGGGTDDDNDDDELEAAIVVDVEDIPLLDPFSKQPIKVPVRFKDCPHIACCDLESWIATTINKRSARTSSLEFVCPNCTHHKGDAARGVDCIEVDLWLMKQIVALRDSVALSSAALSSAAVMAMHHPNPVHQMQPQRLRFYGKERRVEPIFAQDHMAGVEVIDCSQVTLTQHSSGGGSGGNLLANNSNVGSKAQEQQQASLAKRGGNNFSSGRGASATAAAAGASSHNLNGDFRLPEVKLEKLSGNPAPVRTVNSIRNSSTSSSSNALQSAQDPLDGIIDDEGDAATGISSRLDALGRSGGGSSGALRGSTVVIGSRDSVGSDIALLLRDSTTIVAPAGGGGGGSGAPLPGRTNNNNKMLLDDDDYNDYDAASGAAKNIMPAGGSGASDYFANRHRIEQGGNAVRMTDDDGDGQRKRNNKNTRNSNGFCLFSSDESDDALAGCGNVAANNANNGSFDYDTFGLEALLQRKQLNGLDGASSSSCATLGCLVADDNLRTNSTPQHHVDITTSARGLACASSNTFVLQQHQHQQQPTHSSAAPRKNITRFADVAAASKRADEGAAEAAVAVPVSTAVINNTNNPLGVATETLSVSHRQPVEATLLGGGGGGGSSCATAHARRPTRFSEHLQMMQHDSLRGELQSMQSLHAASLSAIVPQQQQQQQQLLQENHRLLASFGGSLGALPSHHHDAAGGGDIVDDRGLANRVVTIKMEAGSVGAAAAAAVHHVPMPPVKGAPFCASCRRFCSGSGSINPSPPSPLFSTTAAAATATSMMTAASAVPSFLIAAGRDSNGGNGRSGSGAAALITCEHCHATRPALQWSYVWRDTSNGAHSHALFGGNIAPIGDYLFEFVPSAKLTLCHLFAAHIALALQLPLQILGFQCSASVSWAQQQMWCLEGEQLDRDCLNWLEGVVNEAMRQAGAPPPPLTTMVSLSQQHQQQLLPGTTTTMTTSQPGAAVRAMNVNALGYREPMREIPLPQKVLAITRKLGSSVFSRKKDRDQPPQPHQQQHQQQQHQPLVLGGVVGSGTMHHHSVPQRDHSAWGF